MTYDANARGDFWVLDVENRRGRGVIAAEHIEEEEGVR